MSVEGDHMNVIQYLKNSSLEKLSEEFSIVIKKHDALPIFILNYDQIDSPKDHPVVMECRSLVLDYDYNIVAKSFNRFFNYGEMPDFDKNFDWTNFSISSKEDGSLILIYYYNGSWRVNSRNSFGDGQVGSFGYAWRDLVDKIVGSGYDDLDKGLTYVCELCTPYNKVVRSYDSSRLYLLAVFEKDVEVSYDKSHHFFSYPNEYMFDSIIAINDWIEKNSSVDPSFEGFVLKDVNNMRLKIKSRSYFDLHRLKNNGILTPDFIIDSILRNETAEIFLYFPEYKEMFAPAIEFVDSAINEIQNLWDSTKDIFLQSEFASKVKSSEFSAYLFLIRKLQAKDIRSVIVSSPAVLLKVFKKRVFELH